MDSLQCIHDNYNRPINYLRISVTDRCNLRCQYCMADSEIDLQDHYKMLTYEEIAKIVKVAASLGISKVRLTGGEPLVRAEFPKLVRMLSSIEGIDDLSLTTNGVLLSEMAMELVEAGLNRVNISLDTLDPHKFAQLTKRPFFEKVMQGIDTAKKVGLNPVKINTVVMRGFNDDELVDVAAKSIEADWHIRFIELMPIAYSNEWLKNYISSEEIKTKIEESLGKLIPCQSRYSPKSVSNSDGPAKYYRFDGAKGTVGFISPVSEHFCQSCNRLRLTSDGKLRPCLLSDNEIDLRSVLRSDDFENGLRQAIIEAISNKPRHHRLDLGEVPISRKMSQIGG